MSEEELVKEIATEITRAHEKALRVLGESGLKEIFRYRAGPPTQTMIAAVFRAAASEVVQAMKDKGFALPPPGDLRTQLLALGRTLKAESFSAGYSGDGGVEEKIAEARAETKSDIGRALLDALANGS